MRPTQEAHQDQAITMQYTDAKTMHKGDTMDPRHEPDVWRMIFEQTPVALRWALGVASMGIFTLASVLYKLNRNNMERIEQRIDNLDERIDRSLREQNKYLAQIASNTGRDR